MFAPDFLCCMFASVTVQTGSITCKLADNKFYYQGAVCSALHNCPFVWLVMQQVWRLYSCQCTVLKPHCAIAADARGYTMSPEKLVLEQEELAKLQQEL